MSNYSPSSAYHAALIKTHGKEKAMRLIREIGNGPSMGTIGSRKRLTERLGTVYGAHKRTPKRQEEVLEPMERLG